MCIGLALLIDMESLMRINYVVLDSRRVQKVKKAEELVHELTVLNFISSFTTQQVNHMGNK